MTTYEMVTIDNGTRIRDDHNTLGIVETTVPANVKVTGDELFIATANLSNSNGVYQYKDDKWLKVTYNGITGWMAYIHKGLFICDGFREIETVPPEPPQTVYPSFIEVRDPENPSSNEWGLYQFVRKIEK